MKNSRTVQALLLCTLITFIGAAGYMLIDDYPLLDAIYMSVITITTVGFGEIRPLSEAGRMFTTGLILLGFSCLAFAGHAVVESLLEKVWSGNSEKKKMQKKIDALKGHYIICGFGRVGKAAAEQLAHHHTGFVIIEHSPEQIALIRKSGFLYLEGDATDENLLLQAGIKNASGVLALLASDPLNLFVTLSAREMNPTLQIIARSGSEINDQKILKAGADDVVSPHAMAGEHIANDILAAAGKYNQIITSGKTSTNPEPRWLKVVQGSGLDGSTIAEISRQGGNKILGLRKKERDIIQPDEFLVVDEGDEIFILEVQVPPVSQSNSRVPKKLVIIDDNPVIRHLYSRLFQKAGFVPITADDGEEGLLLIRREKPVAAVIDYMLPGISGIEVCEKIRRDEEYSGITLIIFTADQEPATREKALRSGADEVIVKSADAQKIVETVTAALHERTPAGSRQGKDERTK
ncbi:MAG: NAD-binding protein [Proteobacteria bacterium]|nr:NAD-binding protein [Pseudomonadota bacterium]MBU1737603.1 NAD-binding protein [Pseudomonadota bacterium]